jgi:O-antigen ligase
MFTRDRANVASNPRTVGHRMAFWLWMLWAGGSLMVFPLCLDWQLVPRFCWIALCLSGGGLFLWKTFRQQGDWRHSPFLTLLWVWYALNLASVTWAFSKSEALFYTQKVFLFAVATGFFYQCLYIAEEKTRRTLYHATLLLTVVAIGVLFWETGTGIHQHGLDNDRLYDAIHLLSGNKSLSSDFLFFLAILHLIFHKEQPRKGLLATILAVLLLLIVLLQTRTVYAAVATGGTLWLVLWAAERLAWRHLLVGFLVFTGVGLAIFRGIQQKGGSLAERLDPRTWLESVSASERRFVWYKTDLLNREHYWWGVGNGAWKFRWLEHNVQGSYRLEELQVSFTRTHNDYLEIRAELGMMGALLFCGWYFWAMVMALRVWKTTKGSQRRAAAALLAGFAGYGIIQYFDFPRERMEMQLWLALLCALLLREVRHPSAASDNVDSGWQRLLTALLSERSARPLPDFVPKAGAMFLSAGLLLSVWTGLGRISGEVHTYRMYEASERGNHLRAAHEAALAENLWYRYDDVAIPLMWHQGNAWVALRQFDKALPCYEAAWQLHPWSHQVLHHYGNALTEIASDTDTTALRRAAALYASAVALNPRYDPCKFNLAYVYLRLKEPESARYWIEQVDTVVNPRTSGQEAQNQFLKEQQAVWRQRIEVARSAPQK